jgi:hypothetical protein
MASFNLKPPAKFHMPSPSKKIADDTIRKKPVMGMKKPKMKLNPGLSGLKIKL